MTLMLYLVGLMKRGSKRLSMSTSDTVKKCGDLPVRKVVGFDRGGYVHGIGTQLWCRILVYTASKRPRWLSGNAAGCHLLRKLET
jgi:hypothetical protein